LKTVLVETNSIGNVYMSVLKKRLGPAGAKVKGFTTTNASKREVVELVQHKFQTHTLTIPNDADLLYQLGSFTVKLTQSGTKVTYENASSTDHDDCVMSLCFLCKAADTRPATMLTF